MVADTRSTQFFLKSERAEGDILNLVGTAFGFLVESTDVDIPDSVGFAQIASHTQGFQQSILVTWPHGVELMLAPGEMIKVLSARLDVCVLLEPATDGDAWLLAEPDGSVRHVNVSYLDDGIAVSGIP